MAPSADHQRIVDEEHLRLLAVFHWVIGGITAVFSLIPIIHLVIGLAMMSGKLPMGPPPGTSVPPNSPPPEEMVRVMGGFFVAFALFFIGAGLTFAGLTMFSARCLGRRRYRTFSLVVGCLNCLLVPFGTVLGVFTLLVLSRPSVLGLYQSPPGQDGGPAA